MTLDLGANADRPQEQWNSRAATVAEPQDLWPDPLAIYVLSTYTGPVDIEFDPKKNAANLRKHGVSLAEGDGVLNDPLALTIEDETAQGEQRFLTLGMNVLGALMVVVWTRRGESIRVISVRKAEPRERRAYAEGS